MNSVTLGWALVVIGVLTYLIGFIASIVMFVKRGGESRGLPAGADLKAVAEVLDKLAEVLDKFAKLSVPIQWALLGMLNIGIGAYLIANKPF
ncbi:MAG TPA: hypothetical protein VF544_17460 [Pyrinomonadaceae bacterium]|jgi:uncharacterized membrane protein YiaA